MTDTQYSPEEFTALVTREIKREATPEEITYLWSSESVMDRWRTELVLTRTRIERQLSALRNDLTLHQQRYTSVGKSQLNEWFADRAEMQDKLRRTQHFIGLILERIVRINQMKREQKEPTLLKLSSTDGVKHYRTGYLAGWRKAIGIMCGLLRNGLDEEDAYQICYAYWEKELREWRDSEDVHMLKPTPPHWKRIENETGGNLSG